MQVSRTAALGLLPLTIAAILGAGLPAALAGPTPLAGPAPHPSAYALSQIAALQAEKAALTPIQRKVESNLLRAALFARPASQASGSRPSGSALSASLNAKTLSLLKTIRISHAAQPDAQGMVLVDIKGTISASLLAQIKTAGGVIKGQWPAFRALRASVPVTQLEAIAGVRGVLSIRPAAQGHVVRSQASPQDSLTPLVPGLFQTSAAPVTLTGATAEARQVHVRAVLPALLACVQTASVPSLRVNNRVTPSLAALVGGIGSLNTADPEGDAAHRADLARKTFHVTGSGVKIGVLSDSVDGLAQEQRKGSLGSVTVLPGQSGIPGSGEGTAMLEIVHRIAPGAKLYFATANNGEASFAQNILDLKAAGCQIIVDDFGYFDEPPFQDGIIAQAVDTVSVAGAFYFSSAGNDFNLDQQGITAAWEGDFIDSGATFSVDSGPAQPLLAFDSQGDIEDQVLTATGYYSQDIFLFWANPQSTDTSGATDDYDLYVLDSTGSQVLYSSTDPHTGAPGQDPIQACEADQGNFILVAKNHGQAVDLHLYLTSDGVAALRISTAAVTYGHDSAASCYGTAAVDASVAYGGNRSFTTADVTEAFSSDGPRRIIFNADGTEITPGDRTSTGGTLRQQPVLAAADGITDFFNPFYGTSAAAPHAAAIAGLVLSANPSLASHPDQMFSLLTTSCIPIDTDFGPLPNRDTGYGLLDAYTAVQKAVSP